MEPLAKPSGILLRDHRQHVFDEAKALLNAWPHLEQRYAERCNGASLRKRLADAAWWHDIGKEHDTWQSACRKDYKVYRAWRVRQGLAPDEVNADDYRTFQRAAFRDYKAIQEARTAGRPVPEHLVQEGTALRDARIRHEMASLKRVEGKDFPLAVRAAIAAHHGHLNRRKKSQRRWQGDDGGRFKDLWDGFVKASDDVNEDEAERLMARYEVAAVRALLVLADQRASAREAGNAMPNVQRFTYTFEHEKKRPVQQALLDALHADPLAPTTVLRAPTGSGKTDAALLWAQQHIEAGLADRVVVAMPTRFTSNALAVTLEKGNLATGLYHSSAWYVRSSPVPEREHARVREEQRLAQRLAMPATVCTVDHLLLSLIGAKEDHYATFFFLAHSAVVFDEVDFYDPFVQANLMVLLRVLRTLGVPVLLMSATVPESARDLYNITRPTVEATQEEGGPRTVHLLPEVADIAKHHGSVPQSVVPVLERMVHEGCGIIYANTVARAAAYYTWFKNQKACVCLYHSQFTEPDKKAREDQILRMLGRDAWRGGLAGGIVVFTQIGEMSINVSAPLMLSELCPWDRLAQRLGRLNRFGEVPAGDAWVVVPFQDGKLYPAPYGAYLKKTNDTEGGWEAGEAFVQTQAQLERDFAERSPVTAQDLSSQVDALYPEPPVFDATTAQNTANLEDMLERNWLIAQAQQDDDEGTAGDFRTRNIEPHTVLVTCHPWSLESAESCTPDDDRPFHFDTYSDLQAFLLKYGVSVPVYLRERAEKAGLLVEIPYTVGEGRAKDEEQRVLLHFTGYTPETGTGPLYGVVQEPSSPTNHL
ncbi:MAG: CRISPR-associated helicase Cas3' [Bacteroidetes bacterium]|nr:CRISPR-associated helicase Cas3' [Bacteroidota bacterium]